MYPAVEHQTEVKELDSRRDVTICVLRSSSDALSDAMHIVERNARRIPTAKVGYLSEEGL